MRLKVCLGLGACLALLALPAVASDTAIVIGIVTDDSGAAVPGATVTARNVNTGVARTVVTIADGHYRIPVLPPGQYEFTVELPGFSRVRRSGVNLSLGSEVTLGFQLKPAAVTEELTVVADAPLVETTNAAVQTIVNREQIDLLPLISRDYFDLVRLTPGAVVTNGQGTSFTGSPGRGNVYLIDGVDNSEDISGFDRQGFNLDGVEEFQVIANNFKAEYGRAAGGVISVLTRSGTNAYRGSAFYLFRSDDLIARNPFLAPGAPKDPFTRKQWGGTIGGPLVKNRTHFFLTFEYEGLDTNTTTTRPYPPPGATVSAATRGFLAQHNVPAFPDTSAGTQVRLVRPEKSRDPSLTARIDHNISSNQVLTFRFNWRRDTDVSQASGTIFDANGMDTYSRSAYGSVNHKWIRSANHLNELYFQFGKSELSFIETNRTLPNIFIDEFSTTTAYLGAPTNRPQGRNDTTYQIIDNYTITAPNGWLGGHVIKFGGDAKLFRSDSYFDSNFRGRFDFTTVANFLAGRPRRFTQNQGNSQLDRPNSIFALYVQDDWRVSPRLTLNLGVRYDYENGKTEALRDVAPGSAACPLSGACGEAGPGISGDKNNISPRFGVNWDVEGNGRTVVHAGAGIYYDQIILNIQGNARFTPPKVIGVQIENPTFPNPFLGGAAATLRPNLSVIDPDLVTPRNANTSLGVRREITRNMAVDATFVWNKGFDHVLIINTNSIDPATRVRPNPTFTNIDFYTNEKKIDYKGLLFEVRKRMARNHSWGISYTLSHSRNNSETIFTSVQDPRDIDRSYGPAVEDRRHVVVGNFLVRLPWDFQVGGIFEWRSERPLDVFVGGRDLNGDGITGDWPPGYSRNQFNGSPLHELSLAEANRLRALYGLAPIAAYADNDKFWNLDMQLQKSIKIGGHRRLKVTVECFNVLNHPNFAQPGQSITSSLFGQVTAIDTQRDARPRSFQLTGQIDF